MSVHIERVGDDILIRGIENYRIEQIFDCGQTFRFEPERADDGKVTVRGVALGRELVLEQSGDSVTVRNMTEEVSDIYGGEKPTHHTLRVLLLAIFILFLIPAMLFLMIIGDSVLNYVAQFLPITVEFISFWTKARFLSMGFALILLTSAVYYLSPSQPPKWRYIFPGALLSTSFWMLYSVFFSYYVDHMGNYSVIYGSIGAIIAFLIWLNLSLTALLLGAVFNQALRETAAHEKLSSEI